MGTSGVVIGTPTYMSPEQCRGAALDPRSDLYSLACIAYEMLAGRPPFLSDSVVGYIFAHVQQAPDLTKLAPNVPEGLVSWVGRCLEKDPAARFTSADEARDALLASVSVAPSPTSPSFGVARSSTSPALPTQTPTPPTPLDTGRSSSPPSRRTGRWFALGGGLVAVALLTWGVVEITSPSSSTRDQDEPTAMLGSGPDRPTFPLPVTVTQTWGPIDHDAGAGTASPDTTPSVAATAADTSSPGSGGPLHPSPDFAERVRSVASHTTDADTSDPADTSAPEVSAPATQHVALSSVPTGATVKRDGQVLGKTPLELTWMVGETTPFKVELKNYDTATLPLTTLTGKTIHEVRLTRSTAKDAVGGATLGSSSLGPKSADELYKEARALHNTDPNAALKLYQQAAAKGHASSYKMVGSIQVKLGNTSAAIVGYKRYLALVPEAKDADMVRDIITRLGGTP